MTEIEKKAEIERTERMLLKSKVEMLFSLCTDSGVEKYFDLHSNKMLKKKERVLTALNDGKEVSEKDYYSILEKMPKDEDGNPTIDIWW
mgnify:CR=1 FL=1